MLIAIIAVAALAALYLFLIAANPGGRAKAFHEQAFAHRGLHDESIPENSLTAFEKAVEAGYGIELDVRFTKDDQIVVCHDDDLKRVMGIEKKVSETELGELRKLFFPGTEECVPLFSEVLSLVNGRVPILVEIKNCARIKELTERTAMMLREYKGPYLTESFDPRSLMYLRKCAPEMVRGQLVTKPGSYENGFQKLVLPNLLLNVIARPDFIACDLEWEKGLSVRIDRGLFGAGTAMWTVRKRDDVRKGRMNIFEGFRL